MEKMQILDALRSLAGEKKLPENTILEAMQESIETATKRAKPSQIAWEVRVALDSTSGNHMTYRRWLVVEDDQEENEETNPDAQIILSEALKKEPKCQVGEWLEEEIPSVEFNRIAIHHAIPILKRKVQEASKLRTVDQFRTHIGKMVQGTIKRLSRDSVSVDLGDGAEATLFKSEQIPQDSFHEGDAVKALLHQIVDDARGSPQLLLDRKGPKMLEQLFHIEVPEIGEGTIEIKAVARIAGSRSKIAVFTMDGRIDPVGACVGMRGSRVQAVSNQLCNERIDIILWDDNQAYLAANAIRPAEVISASIDVDQGLLNIVVSQEDLPQAIGRSGENVKLVEQLTGMNLDILSADDFEKKQVTDREKYIQDLTEKLDLEEEIAVILVDNEFETTEDIAESELQELGAIEEFDDDLAEELKARAQEALAKEIQTRPTEQLLSLLKQKRMAPSIVNKITSAFIAKGIRTVQDLADLDIYELQEVATENDFEINDKQAGTLILDARDAGRNIAAEDEN